MQLMPKENHEQENLPNSHSMTLKKQDDTESSEKTENKAKDEEDKKTTKNQESEKEETAKEEVNLKEGSKQKNEIEIEKADEKQSENGEKNEEKNEDSYAVEMTKQDAYNVSNAYMLNASLPTFNDLLAIDLDHVKVPTNLNILFIGDSISRYRYTSLVHFLAYGKWVENDEKPNLVDVHSLESRVDFYNFSYTKLYPYEFLCDCYHPEGTSPEIGWAKLMDKYYVDNRYFYDPVRNNSVVHLSKFDNWPFHSSYNASEVNDMRRIESDHRFDKEDQNDEHKAYKAGQKKLVTDAKELQLVIDHRSWKNYIEDFVCKLDPKPSLVFFNQGLWPGKGYFDSPVIQEEIMTAFKSCDLKTVYETTTRRFRETSAEVEEYEKELCARSDHCFDRSWTVNLPKDLYLQDGVHLSAIANNWMNVFLLDFLSMTEKETT